MTGVNYLDKSFKKKGWSNRHNQNDGPFKAHLPIDKISRLVQANSLAQGFLKEGWRSRQK